MNISYEYYSINSYKNKEDNIFLKKSSGTLNIFIVNLTSFLFFISFHIILYIHVYNNAVKLQCTKIIYILENRIHMHLRIKILNINDAKKKQ